MGAEQPEQKTTFDFDTADKGLGQRETPISNPT
jgi:hypothetical protein